VTNDELIEFKNLATNYTNCFRVIRNTKPTGYNRFPLCVNNPGLRADPFPRLAVSPYSNKSSFPYGEGLRNGESRVDRHDLCVENGKVRGLFRRQLGAHPENTNPQSQKPEARSGRPGAIRSGIQFLPRDARKGRGTNESDMECGGLSDLSPLSF